MPGYGPILSTLAALPTDTALSADDTRRGWALFALVALLGIVLIGCAVLLVIMSSRRRRLTRLRRRSTRSADPRDPWTESAKRMPATDETVDLD